jgi:hypothetical protein
MHYVENDVRLKGRYQQARNPKRGGESSVINGIGFIRSNRSNDEKPVIRHALCYGYQAQQNNIASPTRMKIESIEVMTWNVVY